MKLRQFVIFLAAMGFAMRASAQETVSAKQIEAAGVVLGLWAEMSDFRAVAEDDNTAHLEYKGEKRAVVSRADKCVFELESLDKPPYATRAHIIFPNIS